MAPRLRWRCGCHRRRHSGEGRVLADFELVVEPDGAKDLDPCQCCGGQRRRIWGYVHDGETALAAYFLTWTVGQVPWHGARLDLILGDWEDGSTPENRFVVSLEYRRTETETGFRVVDADDSRSSVASRSLRAEEVVDTEIAKAVFAIAEAIYAHDPRTAEIQGREG
jgi:hypothetical protein